MEDEIVEVKKDPTVEELLAQLNELKLKSVSKEEYDKALENNSKLIKEVTTNRHVVTNEPKAETQEDIIKRCKARTASMGSGDSFKDITNLVANYRDMEKLGMDLEGISKRDVEGLEAIIKDANNDPLMFKSLLESRIKKSF